MVDFKDPCFNVVRLQQKLIFANFSKSSNCISQTQRLWDFLKIAQLPGGGIFFPSKFLDVFLLLVDYVQMCY